MAKKKARTPQAIIREQRVELTLVRRSYLDELHRADAYHQKYDEEVKATEGAKRNAAYWKQMYESKHKEVETARTAWSADRDRWEIATDDLRRECADMQTTMLGERQAKNDAENLIYAVQAILKVGGA